MLEVAGGVVHPRRGECLGGVARLGQPAALGDGGGGQPPLPHQVPGRPDVRRGGAGGGGGGVRPVASPAPRRRRAAPGGPTAGLPRRSALPSPSAPLLDLPHPLPAAASRGTASSASTTASAPPGCRSGSRRLALFALVQLPSGESRRVLRAVLEPRVGFFWVWLFTPMAAWLLVPVHLAAGGPAGQRPVRKPPGRLRRAARPLELLSPRGVGGLVRPRAWGGWRSCCSEPARSPPAARPGSGGSPCPSEPSLWWSWRCSPS